MSLDDRSASCMQELECTNLDKEDSEAETTDNACIIPRSKYD